QNREDDGALNFLILEDKESLEEEGNDTKVVINPDESDEDGDDGLVIWLENMLEEPTSPIYRPPCVRDWPKGCGPKLKSKARKRMAKRRRKAKVRKASQCWFKPCVQTRRARKKEARRRGLRWVEDGCAPPKPTCTCCAAQRLMRAAQLGERPRSCPLSPARSQTGPACVQAAQNGSTLVQRDHEAPNRPSSGPETTRRSKSGSTL
ncbi:Unknown protein, partial [Striga hermonthica]